MHKNIFTNSSSPITV